MNDPKIIENSTHTRVVMNGNIAIVGQDVSRSGKAFYCSGVMPSVGSGVWHVGPVKC